MDPWVDGWMGRSVDGWMAGWVGKPMGQRVGGPKGGLLWGGPGGSLGPWDGLGVFWGDWGEQPPKKMPGSISFNGLGPKMVPKSESNRTKIRLKSVCVRSQQQSEFVADTEET